MPVFSVPHAQTHFPAASGFGLPQFEQNFPLFSVPHLPQIHTIGLALPQFEQKLPVFSVPQEHFHTPFAASCCVLEKMEELSESITQYGVLVPGIVRLRESGGYELVAGHRRKRACELAGLEKMPVIIKDLTDDEATVIMVDSNIQREELLISEKAFAYKMKYEALKRQGKRSDLTSCQVGKKLAAEEVSQNTGDSSRQILRYIHLTELIAELLELADEKKLPFNTAVEVSYLRSEEQQILLQYMSNHNMVPSMKQAKELKQIAKEQMLTYSEIDQICMNESTEKVQVQIPAKKLKQYFPESYSKAQMEEVIFMLLASWAEKQ